jgi:hypothetical protein
MALSLFHFISFHFIRSSCFCQTNTGTTNNKPPPQQAAQNMSATHMQTGLCSVMPDSIKTKFAESIATKSSGSGAGRPYWAESAATLGLIDTDLGMFFVRDLPLPPPPPNTTNAAAAAGIGDSPPR